MTPVPPTPPQPGPLLLLAEYVEAMCDEGADAYLSLSRAFELEAKLRAFSPAALRAQAAAEAELRGKLEAAEAELERLRVDHLRDIRAARELRATDEHAAVMGVLRARLAHSSERGDALWVNPFEVPHLLAAFIALLPGATK